MAESEAQKRAKRKYRSRDEIKAKRAAYMREYRARPYVKEKARQKRIEYMLNETPEQRAERLLYAKVLRDLKALHPIYGL
jgi:hypothetical protein